MKTNMLNKHLLPVVGILCVSVLSLSSLNAQGLEPSLAPSSVNFQTPKNLKLPDEYTKNLKGNIINNKNIPKPIGGKPTVKISMPKEGKMLREIDYYRDGEIVIPLYTHFAYDGAGNHLSNSALSWAYSKKGTRWTNFATGRSVKLKLSPEATLQNHNSIYKVNIRLTGKDPKNGLTSTDITSVSLHAITQ